MPKINFLGQSANSKSIDENNSTLINWYLTDDQDQAKYDKLAYPTPGFGTPFCSINTPLRALYSEHGILYAVGGNTFYTVSSGGVATTLGTLTTSTGFAKITGINDQIIVIDGVHGYTYVISTNTWNGQISDVNFPQDCIDVVTQDEFCLVAKKNSQTWVQSAISDLTTWPPLAFASVTGYQSNLVAIASLHREVWLFQQNTIEVWDNLGTTNFSFGRNQSVFIEWGCAARSSVAKANSQLYWLGYGPNGGPQVITNQGYAPQVISTRAINYQISTYAVVSDALGFTYQQEGHEFYVLSFPTQGVTWVYDISTTQWHQRQSLISGVQTQWLADSFSFCYGKNLIGDLSTGNIYALSTAIYQENGVAITRTLITHPFYSDGLWQTVDRLQTDWDESSASASNVINLFVSRDGGRTFGSNKPNSLAGAGNTISGPRVWWARLGAAKTFVFMITTTMNAPAILMGAWANVRNGTF